MGKQSRGFTLIEAVLFLGVTGLIMSALLVGVGAGLNNQKYRDASNELLGFVQNQFNLVTNVNNSRPTGDTSCPGLATSVGASDCTIVGRLIQTTDGVTITTTQVVATTEATRLPLNMTDSDAKILKDANLVVKSGTPDTYTPAWNTVIVEPGLTPPVPATFSILIVRMPTSGAIHTYIHSSGTATPAAFFAANPPTPQTADIKLCLDPKGLLGAASQPTGVMIKANAANSSGVTFVSQGNC